VLLIIAGVQFWYHILKYSQQLLRIVTILGGHKPILHQERFLRQGHEWRMCGTIPVKQIFTNSMRFALVELRNVAPININS
jgi:hypothetical protein